MRESGSLLATASKSELLATKRNGCEVLRPFGRRLQLSTDSTIRHSPSDFLLHARRILQRPVVTMQSWPQPHLKAWRVVIEAGKRSIKSPLIAHQLWRRDEHLHGVFEAHGGTAGPNSSAIAAL